MGARCDNDNGILGAENEGNDSWTSTDEANLDARKDRNVEGASGDYRSGTTSIAALSVSLATPKPHSMSAASAPGSTLPSFWTRPKKYTIPIARVEIRAALTKISSTAPRFLASSAMLPDAITGVAICELMMT